MLWPDILKLSPPLCSKEEKGNNHLTLWFDQAGMTFVFTRFYDAKLFCLVNHGKK